MHEPEPGPPSHPRNHLLDLARAAVLAVVDGRLPPRPDPDAHPELAPHGDAFVTLTDRGELRGCMGTLGADLPAGEAIVRAAGLAASRDPRFRPVGAAEVEQLQVEVSVLGPSRPLADPADFVAGRDGIVVVARGRRALLLPQVATEMGWGTEEMLDHVCRKAGLRAREWQDREAQLSVFEVDRVAGPVVEGVGVVALATTAGS